MVVLSVAGGRGVTGGAQRKSFNHHTYVRTVIHIHTYTYIHTECFTSQSGSSHFFTSLSKKKKHPHGWEYSYSTCFYGINYREVHHNRLQLV